MRGLTTEEYDALQLAASNSGCSEECPTVACMPDDTANTMKRLEKRGLVQAGDCKFDVGAIHDYITPLGREALHIADAIRALQEAL